MGNQDSTVPLRPFIRYAANADVPAPTTARQMQDLKNQIMFDFFPSPEESEAARGSVPWLQAQLMADIQAMPGETLYVQPIDTHMFDAELAQGQNLAAGGEVLRPESGYELFPDARALLKGIEYAPPQSAYEQYYRELQKEIVPNQASLNPYLCGDTFMQQPLMDVIQQPLLPLLQNWVPTAESANANPSAFYGPNAFV